MSSFRLLGMLGLAGLLASACAPNGAYINPWNPWVTPAPTPVPVVYSDVYKYQGSRQCEGGGVPLAEMQRQLQAAGAGVVSSSCGTDGRMYPAFCGGADGRINIFTINRNALNAAMAQGFFLLSDLPEAQRSSCYTANPSTSTTYSYTGGGNTSYYSYQ